MSENNICCFILDNIGEVIGQLDVNQKPDSVWAMEKPRAVRQVKTDAGATPPNAVRTGPNHAFVFIPLVGNPDILYIPAPAMFSVVKDKEIINAYIAATTGLVMASVEPTK
ncbi:MAG TPA: hypothetical protein ENN95_02440 [Deltaproteobacteria bacterium]|nr:hypothetical protein [Deltaproteobacteria bacterium]